MQTARLPRDVATVERLDRLARSWGMSRSAALRKLVLEADAPEAHGRLAAWKRLRGSLSPAQTGTWRRQLRLERAASDPDRRRAR
ncbi:MAG: ribbon-helix-helix protein, CopG family [Terriglobales bacterium]